MKENKNIPEIRFKGFEGEWDKEELGKLTDVYDGTHQTPKYLDKGVMFLSVENINTLKSEKYISIEDFKKDFKTYPQKGDVLMTRIGDVGTANIVESNELLAYYVSLALLKYKLLNPYFLKACLSSIAVVNDIWHRTLHIAFPKKINMYEINKIIVPYPKSNKEQSQIGTFFQKLDKQITLEQQKHDKLVTLKKAMLEKMFPKEGASVPEIRFEGFEGEWEAKFFNEAFLNLTNNALSRADLNYKKGKYKNVHYGDVLIKFGELLDIKNDSVPFITNDRLAEKINYSKLQNGDIIIADTAEDESVGKCTELVNIENEEVLSGLHTIPVRPIEPFASKYLGYYMNSPSYHNQLIQLMQGIKVLSISKSAIKNTVLVYPANKKEQSQIGSYFQNLDKLISLQQQKIDKLKNIKKACLEKMFI